MKIKDIQAREILDSRGSPTVEVEVELDDGSQAKASVPAFMSRWNSETRIKIGLAARAC